MKDGRRGFLASLRFARDGVLFAWRSEPNLRRQVVLAALWGGVLLLLQPAPVWWALSLLVAGAVIAAELANHALETALDVLHPARDPRIGRAKDCAAAAVLVLAFAALAVAACTVVSVL